MPQADPARRRAARAREVLVLASMMAAVLWGVFLADVSSGTGRGRLSGLPIGTDFVYFYTLAHVGRSGDYTALASDDAFYRAQMRVVPAAADTPYPPVYPPQLALLLSPLATLSYQNAYLSWIAITLALYGAVVWRLAAATPELREWPAQVAAVAAANPALWFTVLHGQVSVLALTAVALCWAALNAGWPVAAGAALGLLAFKPSLFVPAMAILLLARQWRLLGGAVASLAVVWAAMLPWVDVSASREYVSYTLDLLRDPDRVASNLPLMHSLRTFWAGLLPRAAAMVAYAVSAAGVALWTATAWRRSTVALDRVALLVGAVVLISPHVFAYDLLILVPALAAAAACQTRAQAPRALPASTALVFGAPLWGVPAVAAGLQLTTAAIGVWTIVLRRASALGPGTP